MGLTKQYLRHAAAGMFNVIGSPNANVLFIALDGETVSKTCAVAACEHVFIWDLRKGEKVSISSVLAQCSLSSVSPL